MYWRGMEGREEDRGPEPHEKEREGGLLALHRQCPTAVPHCIGGVGHPRVRASKAALYVLCRTVQTDGGPRLSGIFLGPRRSVQKGFSVCTVCMYKHTGAGFVNQTNSGATLFGANSVKLYSTNVLYILLRLRPFTARFDPRNEARVRRHP